MTNKHNYCVILAGGKGKRLWPCSRVDMPKQFLDFFGTGRTQLQQTYDRFAELADIDHIFVCTHEIYRDEVSRQLPDLPQENILAEPVNRNTAPSVAWACYRIKHLCPEARIVIGPSDQAVFNPEAFRHDMEAALNFVGTHDCLLTMGVRPTRPEPGYGYIQIGENTDGENVYRVKSFSEKPERDFARIFMESGEFYWNTGMFLANAQTLADSLKHIFPIVYEHVDNCNLHLGADQEHQYVKENFPQYPNLSMDYGVLEKSDNVYVMCCDFGWADLGTWHSIYEAFAKGENDNVVLDSKVMMEDCHNCIVKLPKGKLGVFNGLDGFIIAEHDNVLMVVKKEDSSALVRKFVNEVQMKWGDEYM